MADSFARKGLFGVNLVLISAIIEAATGLLMIVLPSLFVRLLLGADLSPAGEIVGRMGGAGLTALAVACWPAADAALRSRQALKALTGYNLFAGLFFAFVGIAGGLTGVPIGGARPVASLNPALRASAAGPKRRRRR